MENNTNFNTDENNIQTSELNGLGALTNASMCFESSRFEAPEANPNCLVVDKSKFSTLDSYYTYLRQWFNNTGIVTVQDTTETIKAKLNYAYMFDIGFANSGNKTHAVVACHDIEAAKSFLSNCRAGKFSEPALLFCFYNFDNSDKRIAANNNIELVGISEMYDLNNAITSVFGGLSIGNTLLGRIQKGLRDKFKNQRPITDVAQNSVSEAGEGLMSAISDGFEQLKGSLMSALAAVGAGKLAGSVQGVDNPFSTQSNTPVTQIDSPSAGFENNSGNVDITKSCDESITQSSEKSEEVAKPTVSLKKSDVQTTDNVVEQKDNTINTAEDFLHIES